MLFFRAQVSRKHLLVFVALMSCLFLLATPLSSVHASAGPHGPGRATVAQSSTSVIPCVPSNGAAHQDCFAPSQVLLNSSCSGTQYWGTNDYMGNPIDWTYTNGSSWCVSVRYGLPFVDSRTCTYQFYVPDGYATATFVIGYVSNGVHHVSAPIDEASTSGWYTFLSGVSNVSSFDFSDNNGQPVGSQQLGWGSDWHYSILSWCA